MEKAGGEREGSTCCIPASVWNTERQFLEVNWKFNGRIVSLSEEGLSGRLVSLGYILAFTVQILASSLGFKLTN
jgi:hypothetical protein